MRGADIQAFENENFGVLRTTYVEDTPYFVAADICRTLDVGNVTQAISRLDDDEHLMLNIGRQGNAHLVNEFGLYSLILSSRKPQARKFKRWITHEVLPQLRTLGTYSLTGKYDDLYYKADGLSLNEPVVPQRLFTTEECLSAARIVASCKNERLPYILGLLGAGGWDMNVIQNGIKGIRTDTSDISEIIQGAAVKYGVDLKTISNLTGISIEVLRSYQKGRRFPRQARYDLIVNTIKAFETENEESDDNE